MLEERFPGARSGLLTPTIAVRWSRQAQAIMCVAHDDMMKTCEAENCGGGEGIASRQMAARSGHSDFGVGLSVSLRFRHAFCGTA
jgi:hypothetical protein